MKSTVFHAKQRFRNHTFTRRGEGALALAVLAQVALEVAGQRLA
jgi:hypothetical protein